jgi:hypothetical protein
MCSGFVGTRKVIVGNYFRLSAFDISTMVVSLGMHTQGNLPKPEPQNDAQMTRRVTRVVYHPSYNAKTVVSHIVLPFNNLYLSDSDIEFMFMKL